MSENKIMMENRSENSLSPTYLPLTNITSDASQDSDSDAFPSQVPSPCCILPLEKDIMSPNMISSLSKEHCFFKTGNNMAEADQIQESIGIAAAKVKAFSTEYFVEVQENDPFNNEQHVDEQLSEKVFVDQILHRINSNNFYENETEMPDFNGANITLQSNISLYGKTVDQSILRNNVSLASSFENSDQIEDTGILNLENSSNNSHRTSSESFVSEDDVNDDDHTLVNFSHNVDLFKSKLPFWNKSCVGNYFKVDTPTTSGSCEDHETRYFVEKCGRFTENYSSEANVTFPESENINMKNEYQQEERGEQQTSDRQPNTRCEMLNIIQELRRLSGNETVGLHSDYCNVQLVEKSDYSSDNNVSFETFMSIMGDDLKDVYCTREVSATNETIDETSDDYTHIKENFDLENCSLDFSRFSSPSSDKTLLCTAPKSKKHFLPESDTPTLYLNNFTLVKPLQGSCAQFPRNEKRHPDSKIFIRENKPNEINLPDRGIFRTAKEKSQNFCPKRVSFRADSLNSESDNMLTKPDIPETNMASSDSETSFDESISPNLNLNDCDPEWENDSSCSLKRMGPHRFADLFRRTLNQPSKNECYLSYDIGPEARNIPVLGTTTFGRKGNESELKFIERQQLNEGIFDQTDEKDELLDGATNFAFLLESPTTKCSQVQDIYNDDDDNGRDRTFTSFMPRNVERNIQEMKISINEKVRKLPIKQSSVTCSEKYETVWQKRTFVRKWHSLDDSLYEMSPLKSSRIFCKDLYNGSSKAMTIVHKIEKGPDKPTLAPLPNLNEHRDSDAKDEDTLSLEFFVPGKKKYIRLHRRTFLHFVLKYAVFFFTFLFWIASLSGIGFSAWMQTSNTVVIDDVSDVFLDPYVLMGVVSGIVFFVSFFGCVGALRENICLLKLFHINLTAVLVLEVLLSILIFLFYTMPEFRLAVKVGPEEVLKKAVKEYFDNEALGKWIDRIQKEFQCCGVSMSDHGYMDWQENPYYNCSASNPSVYRCSVPTSCCIFMPGDYINYMCGADIVKKEEFEIIHIINTKGCMKSFGEWLGKNDAFIGYIALGVIIPQILGIITARYFIKSLMARKTTWLQMSDPVQIVTPN